MNHITNWLEIPTSDLARAQIFYEEVLKTTFTLVDLGGIRYAIFPSKNPYNAGALVQGKGCVPSTTGPLLYLNATEEIDILLERIGKAGGKVETPRTFLPIHAGEIAVFTDTEGNRIGLHSPTVEQVPKSISDEMMQQFINRASKIITFLVRKGPLYEDSATQHLQWEHARNMFELLRTGKLQSVTALMNGTDVLGMGTLTSQSYDEAEQLLQKDPGVQGGRLTIQFLTSISFAANDIR